MALTFEAAFCFQNAAETATFTVPGALTLTPPSRLRDPQPSVRCRVEADTMVITAALSSAVALDTLSLHGIRALAADGTDMTAQIASQVRASLADTSAQDGAAFDSGSASGRVHPYYRNLVTLRDGAASIRYVRYDLSAPGAAIIEAGFSMLGLRNQVGINFQPGASDLAVDPSIRTKARMGATHIDDRPDYRRWTFNFGALSETERFSWVEDMDRLCGVRRNILMIRNCASTNLGRDSMLGLLTESAPVVTESFFIDAANGYSKSYSLEDRI